MTRAAHVAILAAGLAALLAACASEEMSPIPRAELEEREAALDEASARIAHLSDAGPTAAADLLDHEDARVRRAAARHLGSLGDAGALSVSDLIAALEDPSPRVRLEVARALGEIRDERALDPLVAHLTDDDRKVRLWAWKALKRYDLDTLVPRLMFHASQGTPLKDEAYEDEMGNRYETNVAIRERIPSLGREAVSHLVPYLSSDDLWIRINVMVVFRSLGPEAEEAIPALVELLEDEAPRIRSRAARTLGKIGDRHPSVVPALREALSDESKTVVADARSALKSIEKDPKKKREKRERGKTARGADPPEEAERPKKTGAPPPGAGPKKPRPGGADDLPSRR